MSASPVHDHKSPVRSVSTLSAFLTRLNTGTLAFALFVAFALLNTMRGKEPATRESAPVKATKTDVIDNFSFSPKTFTVPPSATVTWTNHDKAPHAVTSADNQFQKPPVSKAGRSFASGFATAGTYSYFCSIHPQMTGRIIVKQLSAED